MTHDPLGRARYVFDQAQEKAVALPFHEQLQYCAGMAEFLAPVIDGKPFAAAAVYWGATLEAARHHPIEAQLRDRASTAYHEAGHAVAAVLQFIPIERVTLDVPPGETHRGSVIFPDPVPTARLTGRSGHIQALRWATVELAGPEAQRIAGHDADTATQHDGHAERQLLRYSPPMSSGRLIAAREYAREMAREILRANWPAVTRIAERLQLENTLTAADVAALLET